MQKQSTILILAFLLLPGMAWAQSTSSLYTLEKVVVTGEQPGPGLWKVSKGDHVLWIMGTPAVLPKEVIWRSSEVESIIATSQVFLTPGGVELDFDRGFFQRIAGLFRRSSAVSLPDKATLQEILPSDVYTKWQVLQQKYMPHETVERMRPPFAAIRLLTNALSRSGIRLDGNGDVWDTLKKWAKKSKLEITTTPVQKVEIKVRAAKDVLKEYSRDPLAGMGCFTETVNHLESDLDTLQAYANAWAVGDVEELHQLRDRKLNFVSCNREPMISGFFVDGVDQRITVETTDQIIEKASALAKQEEARQWLEATESALSRNKSTFAVMQIDSLLDPNGYLQKLRERGYSVEEPDSR